MNQSQFEFIIDWMRHIETLQRFSCSIEPDYYEDPYFPEREYGNPESPRCYDQFWEKEWYYPAEEMEFNIADDNGNSLTVFIPLDRISNTHISFHNLHNGIKIEGDVDLSIINSIKQLIEKFPDSFFRSKIHAAIYYSNTGNLKKATEYLRIYLETDYLTEYWPRDLDEIRRVFPAEYRNSDEFNELLNIAKKNDII